MNEVRIDETENMLCNAITNFYKTGVMNESGRK